MNSMAPNRFTCCQAQGETPRRRSIAFWSPAAHFLLIDLGKQRRVVVEDRVGQKPRTFVPDLLLGFRFDAELPAVHESHRPAQTVIGFAAIEGLLHVLAKLLVINGFQNMEGATDVLQFPQRLLGLVLPHITRQFAYNRGLRHILLRQRGQDALDIGPFSDNPRGVDFMGRTDQTFAILTGCLEPHQGVHFLVQVLVPRRKAVTEDVQQEEVDLVGSMRIRRVALRLNVGGVVVEQVEHVVALMLMGANDLGIDRYVVGDEGVGAHAFVQPEILGRMAGIEGINLGFYALAVAAGMHDIIDVVQREDRQVGNRI